MNEPIAGDNGGSDVCCGGCGTAVVTCCQSSPVQCTALVSVDGACLRKVKFLPLLSGLIVCLAWERVGGIMGVLFHDH